MTKEDYIERASFSARYHLEEAKKALTPVGSDPAIKQLITKIADLSEEVAQFRDTL